MSSRISLLAITVLALVSFVACGGGSIGTKTGNTTFTIGGTVTGIPTGDSVILADNTTDVLTVGADGNFTFTKQIASGGAYSVTVQTPPPGETCTVANGSGTATANVTNVAVTCTASAGALTITVDATGIAGGGSLVVSDGIGANLTFSADGNQAFADTYASGAKYTVTIVSQPAGETCTLGSTSSGTITANVTVTATCTPVVTTNYTIGGTVSGLTTGGNLVLADNGAFDSLTVIQNGSFQFNRTLAAGSTYAVTVTTQPTGQTCTVTNGNGTANANVTNITIACAATTYTIGGTLSGLTSGTVVLQDNGTENLSVSANGAFTFSTPVAAGSAYAVTVKTNPAGQACLVTNGTGTATANVTTVVVTCSAAVPLSITVSATGISGGGSLIVSDGIGTNLTFASDGNQAFANTYASGASYAVTIAQQPTGETCSLSSNAVGTITANVTVTATCAANGNTFTIGGTIYDLSSNSSTTGVTLQYNSANSQTFKTNGAFTFTNAIASGATYAVTVQTQPASPAQNCTVTNGTGTATANVTNVQVVCISEWTWAAGTDLVAVGGIFPGNSNGNPLYPGTRFGTQSWQDSSGNFWVFGGLGYDINGPTASQTLGGGGESVLSDLWEWNGSTWSFQGGDAQEGQCFDYPTSVGTAGSPSSRSNGVSWIDSSGNLWMFGGYVSFNVPAFCPTAAAFNDLWEFTGGQWIWQGGASTPSQAGSYGTKGVASSTNIPGARYWATGAKDASGNFWLFGGYGVDSAGTTGYLNDLWKFDGTNWTWVAGSNTANPKGVYSGTVAPGGRLGANTWIDSSGNFWVFGGDAVDSANIAGPMNDLWKFPLTGTTWTFVGGSTTNGAGGSYGTEGIADPSNIPGARQLSTSWQTPSGDVFIFGGQRLGGAFYTDLWKYSGSTGQWTWMAGSQSVDLLGVYLGTPAQLQPGSRFQGTSWIDASGNLWLFGGYGMGSLPPGKSVHDGFDSLQDLWEFQP